MQRDPDALRAAVVAEALRWRGTPYHHHGRVLGAGVDCAMLLAEVFERVGAVPHVDAGFYPRQWHLHQCQELFIAWLERVGARRVSQPQSGDVALFAYGHTYSHGAICTGGPDAPLVHAYLRRGVILTRLDEEPLARRPVIFWSVL